MEISMEFVYDSLLILYWYSVAYHLFLYVLTSFFLFLFAIFAIFCSKSYMNTNEERVRAPARDIYRRV